MCRNHRRSTVDKICKYRFIRGRFVASRRRLNGTQLIRFPYALMYDVHDMNLSVCLYIANSVPVATVTLARRTTTQPHCQSNTGPADTTSDCRCLPVRFRGHTTRLGPCRPCQTRSKSNTCKCSARRRTCESTLNSTVRSTE